MAVPVRPFLFSFRTRQADRRIGRCATAALGEHKEKLTLPWLT